MLGSLLVGTIWVVTRYLFLERAAARVLYAFHSHTDHAELGVAEFKLSEIERCENTTHTFLLINTATSTYGVGEL